MRGSEKFAQDQRAKVDWERSYRVVESLALWGTEAVPFSQVAADIFKKNGSSVVLDLPCGDGRNTVLLAKHLPFVLAGDSSSAALALASKRLAYSRLENCITVKMDIFETRILSDQVSGVFCWDLLGHLREPKRALNEMLRICVSGGYVVGSLFALGDATRGSEMCLVGPEEYMYKKKFFYKFYDQPEVQRLVEIGGARMEHLELSTWTEPAHKGFREYEHEHKSWAFVLRKS